MVIAMTFRGTLTLGSALVLLGAQASLAQAPPARNNVLSSSAGDDQLRLPPELPKEIIDAVRRSPKIKSILPIGSAEKFDQQIIKADEIVFQSGGRIVLTNLDLPWVVIAASRIKFNVPDTYSFIQRDLTVTAPKGSDGANGASKPDRTTETGRTGDPGWNGDAGQAGGVGGRRALPDIYLITNDFLDTKGPVPPGVLSLALLVPGIEGGPGGAGGAGGNGGRGGPGKEGAMGLLDCREGGGPGGRGGQAGQGGRGGDGGAGGAGGNLVYVSTAAGVEKLSFVRVNNVGGLGGAPGRGGVSGAPGGGGPGAGRNGLCDPTRPGDPGGIPDPASLGSGHWGPDGAKGGVLAVTVPSVDGLIN